VTIYQSILGFLLLLKIKGRKVIFFSLKMSMALWQKNIICFKLFMSHVTKLYADIISKRIYLLIYSLFNDAFSVFVVHLTILFSVTRTI
jgi:hypothetical protein